MPHKQRERPRKEVSRAKLKLLSPIFRHSLSRDAYVLRGVGNSLGPVVRERAPAVKDADREE